ncbi:MAG: hypothetical protein KF819_33520 [Labilithrix sp.]|nr:hypothetical protein [Labilithrix sp.]
MKKSGRALLVIALVWLVLFEGGAYAFFRLAGASSVEADHVSKPLTGLDRGSAVRLEATVAAGKDVLAPLSQAPCVAALTEVYAVGYEREKEDEVRRIAVLAARIRAGPPHIGIAIGDARVEIPLALWDPSATAASRVDGSMNELPARLEITDAELREARAKVGPRYDHLEVREWTLLAGTPLFVVGRLEDHDGALRLAPDPALGKLVMHPGTQREYIDKLKTMSIAFRIAGGAFVVTGCVPLVILAISRARAINRRRGRAAAGG